MKTYLGEKKHSDESVDALKQLLDDVGGSFTRTRHGMKSSLRMHVIDDETDGAYVELSASRVYKSNGMPDELDLFHKVDVESVRATGNEELDQLFNAMPVHQRRLWLFAYAIFNADSSIEVIGDALNREKDFAARLLIRLSFDQDGEIRFYVNVDEKGDIHLSHGFDEYKVLLSGAFMHLIRKATDEIRAMSRAQTELVLEARAIYYTC